MALDFSLYRKPPTPEMAALLEVMAAKARVSKKVIVTSRKRKPRKRRMRTPAVLDA